MNNTAQSDTAGGPTTSIGRLIVGAMAVLMIAASAAYVSFELIGESSEGSGGKPIVNHRPDLMTIYDLSDLQIDQQAIREGGPWKDGIPSLTTAEARRSDANYMAAPPSIVTPDRIDWLGDDDRVIGVTHRGETRAYAIRLLNYHEIINDVLGGEPIAVLYCPLCDSATVVSRSLEGEVYEFGVSGLLYHSNVLFYDRQEMGLWSQLGMGSVSGPSAGAVLEHLNDWEVVSFASWSRDNPTGTVVDRDTGHDRAYQKSPYEKYFSNDRTMFKVKNNDLMANKTPVIGVRVGELARAYPVQTVAEAEGGRVVDRLGEAEIELVVDSEGVRVERAPDEAVVMHAFWFSWAAFHPETDVYGLEPE